MAKTRKPGKKIGQITSITVPDNNASKRNKCRENTSKFQKQFKRQQLLQKQFRQTKKSKQGQKNQL
jgi:hypothetical protein